MYFETTMHTSKPVETAAIAAQLIKEHTVRDFEALIWTAQTGADSQWSQTIIAITRGSKWQSSTWIAQSRLKASRPDGAITPINLVPLRELRNH